jgi:FkbM family methyltransferase
MQAVIRLMLRLPGVRPAVRALVRRARVPASVTQRLPVEAAFVARSDGLEIEYVSAADDGVGRALYWQGLGTYEPETLPLFRDLADESHVVLDVGANTGVFTLSALGSNPDVVVHAFEPSPAVFDALARNAAANGTGGRLALNQMAIEAEAGEATLHVPDGTWASGSLDPEGFRGLPGKTVAVRSDTLDRYASQHGLSEVDLIKIDVEGFEHLVLGGAHELLRKQRPLVVCECLPGAHTAEMDALLASAGYRIYRLEDGGVVPLPKVVPDESGGYQNFLFVPEEKELPAAVRVRTG